MLTIPSVLLFLCLFALSYAVVWGLRLVPRLVVALRPWRFAVLAILLLACVVSAGCAELGPSGVCAVIPTAATSPATATTPHAPTGAAVAATLIDCTEPAIAATLGELSQQVAQKLEGGSPNFLGDLTALESSGPGAVVCAAQGLLSAACAPAAASAGPAVATSSTATPSIATGPGNLAHVAKPAKLSPAAMQRAQKYLQNVTARGLRFKS